MPDLVDEGEHALLFATRGRFRSNVHRVDEVEASFDGYRGKTTSYAHSHHVVLPRQRAVTGANIARAEQSTHKNPSLLEVQQVLEARKKNGRH